MGLLTVHSCCLCISLDVGAKIIGFVWTLFAAMLAGLYAVPVALVRLPASTMMFYSGLFIISTTLCLTGCAMLVGLFQKRPALMWPWLALTWVTGGTLLLLSCAGLVLLTLGTSADPQSSCVISAYVAYALISLYFATVVRSRREEILDEIKWNSGIRLMRPVVVEKNLYV